MVTVDAVVVDQTQRHLLLLRRDGRPKDATIRAPSMNTERDAL